MPVEALGAIFLFVLAIAALAGLARLLGGRERPSPFELREDALLTKGERAFFEVLERAVDAEVRVFAKVNLGDVFRVRKGLDNKERAQARNQFDRKHVDFLLVERTTLRPIAGVELDDRSHGGERARERDRVKSRIFEEAGLPLVRIAARRSYSAAEIAGAIAEALREAEPAEAR